MRRTTTSLAWLVCLAGLPTAARAELPAACHPDSTSIGWTEPERRPIDDPNAIRWPLDGTIRVAYGGSSCPVEESFTLETADGRPIPAQVRVRVPEALVPAGELPLTLIEIDPVDELAARTDHVLVWDAPDPYLAAYAHFALAFKTSALRMHTVPEVEFAGILAVDPWSDICETERGGGVYFEAGDGPPGCGAAARLLLKVRFEAIIRRDLAYVVERVSTTPLDDDGEPIAAEADDAVVPISYERGGDDRFVDGTQVRSVPVLVPAAPMPRRDCFRVRILDDWGRARGDPEAIACIDMPADIGCPYPVAAGEFQLAEPLRVCENLGLNGADPYAGPRLDGGPDAAPGAGEDAAGGADGCECGARPGHPREPPWWLLLALPLVRIRRPAKPERARTPIRASRPRSC